MSNIADKISKLIAKADSSTHPEEAETFMAKANQLLEAHGIHLMDLGLLQSDDPVGKTAAAGTFYAAESYAKLLGGQLAHYYGCKAVIFQVSRNKYEFAVVGRDSARVTFQLMFPFVMKQVRQQAAAMVKAGEAKTKSRAQTAIGNALAIRLSKLAQADQPRKAQGGVNALVPVDVIQAALNDYWPNLNTPKQRTVSTTGVATARAEGIAINRQTGGSTVKKPA